MPSLVKEWYSFEITIPSSPSPITLFSGYLKIDLTVPPIYFYLSNYYQVINLYLGNDFVNDVLLTTNSIDDISNNNINAWYVYDKKVIPNDLLGYFSDTNDFYFNFSYEGIVLKEIPDSAYYSLSPPEKTYYYRLYGSNSYPYLSELVIKIQYFDVSGNFLDEANGFFYNIMRRFNIDPSCFNEGTKILCLNHEFDEEYIPIENLRKGDLVKSYKHGYRKIDMIGKNVMVNNPEHFNCCMYKMEKTETNGLIEDLIVTGGHGILVDDLGDLEEKNRELFEGTIPEIDDKKLLLAAVSKDFNQIENNGLYTYYHLTLENDGDGDGDEDVRFGIWANGILTETPSKKQFLESQYLPV